MGPSINHHPEICNRINRLLFSGPTGDLKTVNGQLLQGLACNEFFLDRTRGGVATNGLPDSCLQLIGQVQSCYFGGRCRKPSTGRVKDLVLMRSLGNPQKEYTRFYRVIGLRLCRQLLAGTKDAYWCHSDRCHCLVRPMLEFSGLVAAYRFVRSQSGSKSVCDRREVFRKA